MKTRNSKGQFTKIEWTQEEIKLLSELYPDALTADIAKTLKKSIYAVRNKAWQMKLRKSKEFASRTGKMSSNHPNVIATRFQRGHNTHNKGKKMSGEVYEKCKNTMFKKGHLPHNTRQEFDISTRKDKSGRIYKYIRISLGKWVPLHRYLWEKEYGHIPKGYNIQFKDGNSQNVELSNLYMISRNEQISNNTIQRYPEDVKESIRIISKLNKKIKDYEKTNQS
jgi:hypothetical protein